MSMQLARPIGFGANGKCGRIAVDATDETIHSVNITASVGRSGRNRPDDVSTIQQALNNVRPPKGGPERALVVDGLNGPNTEGAIYRFQTTHFGARGADARVDPGHRTLAKLNELQPTQGPGKRAAPGRQFFGGGSTPSIAPLSNKDREVMKRASAGLALAMGWGMIAQTHLTLAIGFTRGRSEFSDHFDLVDRCFKVKSLSSSKARSAMLKIKEIFARMPRAAAKPTDFLQQVNGKSCTNEDGDLLFAYAFMGGFHSNSARLQRVYVCTKNSEHKTVIAMADLMVHEMAHLVGAASGPNMINHGGRKEPAYGMKAFNLTHSEAMVSASNYAWLAWLARLPKSEWMTNTG